MIPRGIGRLLLLLPLVHSDRFARLRDGLLLQDPIQSGRFSGEQPAEEGVRRFLAFNMSGFITSRKESYGYSIEVRGDKGPCTIVPSHS